MDITLQGTPTNSESARHCIAPCTRCRAPKNDVGVWRTEPESIGNSLWKYGVTLGRSSARSICGTLRLEDPMLGDLTPSVILSYTNDIRARVVSPFRGIRSLVAAFHGRITPPRREDSQQEAPPMPSGEQQERLYSLVSDHGGRVRQQTLIEETGWSPSKVSVVLQELESSGSVVRIAVGRENLVALPGEVGDAEESG